MNILFLTMNNFSDINEHSIYPDLIRYFAKKGHTVTVLLPNEKRNNQETYVEKTPNVNVIKVQTGNLFNVNMITKLISRMGVCGRFKKALNQFAADEKYDLVLYSTPPTTFHSLVKYVKKRDGAFCYLMLKDIFPQNAVDLGMISQNGILFKLLRIGEKKLYRVSDTIGCMSPANVEFLAKQDPWIAKENIEVCPNALEVMSKKYGSKSEIRVKYNIPLDKTVFVYGGGLGKAQGIDFLISCIKKVDDEDCFFLICGDGPYLEHLSNLEKEFPEKIKVIKWMPVDEYNMLVYASDVGLIFLDYRFKIPNFPSRLLLYMECWLPILVATDTNCDLGRIAKENEFGGWCESRPGNEDLFILMMRSMYDKNKRINMSKKSRAYFEMNYSVEKVYERIMSHYN